MKIIVGENLGLNKVPQTHSTESAVSSDVLEMARGKSMWNVDGIRRMLLIVRIGKTHRVRIVRPHNLSERKRGESPKCTHLRRLQADFVILMQYFGASMT